MGFLPRYLDTIFFVGRTELMAKTNSSQIFFYATERTHVRADVRALRTLIPSLTPAELVNAKQQLRGKSSSTMAAVYPDDKYHL